MRGLLRVVYNQLELILKGRPRGRRRKRASNYSPSLSDRSSDSDSQKRVEPPAEPPRRLSLRNGAPRYSDEDDKEASAEDRAFLDQLKHFYKQRGETFKPAHSLKDLSLRALYHSVTNAGGYEAACRHKLWRQIHPPQPNTARRHYERFLLSLEKHEVSAGLRTLPKLNGAVEQPTVTIELADSREPSPVPKEEAKDFSVTSKPAEELNREFLDSLPPKEENKVKISVKPVEKLLEEPKKEKQEPQDAFYSELKAKLNLGNADSKFLSEIATAQQELVSSSALSSLSSLVNGHTLPKDQSRAAGAAPGGAAAPARSSLRAVRVKPARAHHNAPASTPPGSLRPDSASSSPPASVASGPGPVTNFGIHHPPPPPAHSDDEIVEVPYKPKTPEIIDLDEYPESPQAVKKKKLDILKERGLEVTALPRRPLLAPRAARAPPPAPSARPRRAAPDHDAGPDLPDVQHPPPRLPQRRAPQSHPGHQRFRIFGAGENGLREPQGPLHASPPRVARNSS
ncbi:fibrous sheath CABYR-binding protein-like [Cydia fagiglandana]|uniref:fibrous sheath CABYR-binding protein-like n=1 Tax=Cydia fagiglandana TaxID=1458189 RepID=UPI002FEE5D4C